MAHFVLDSYALLAYFRNEVLANKHELYMVCINKKAVLITGEKEFDSLI